MKSKTIIWVAVTLLIIGGLLYWIFSLKQQIAYGDKEDATKQAAATVDSLSGKRDEAVENIKTSSQQSADKATNLIKSLPNEKFTIKDTTYSTMCDYLTNYRPTN